MPHLQKIYAAYEDQGMSMVAINIVPEQDRLVPQWKEQGGYTFPILVNVPSQEIISRYNLVSAPLTFLLDTEGKIIRRFDGYRPGQEKEIEEIVRETLSTEDPRVALVDRWEQTG